MVGSLGRAAEFLGISVVVLATLLLLWLLMPETHPSNRASTYDRLFATHPLGRGSGTDVLVHGVHQLMTIREPGPCRGALLSKPEHVLLTVRVVIRF